MRKCFTVPLVSIVVAFIFSIIAIGLCHNVSADSNTCTYINREDGEVRSFRVENGHFHEDDGSDIVAPNSSQCPKNLDGSYSDLYLPAVCTDCSALGIYKDTLAPDHGSALFQITDRYARWSKFKSKFSNNDRITIRKNGRKTSVYALIDPTLNRTYVAIGEFCVQFGCEYGYANAQDKKNAIITITYSPDGVAEYKVTNKIGTSEYKASIKDSTGKWLENSSAKITQDANAKSSIYPEDVGTDQIPNLGDTKRAVDVLVPARIISEGLNQIVIWDKNENEARIDDLSSEVRYTIDTPGKYIFVNNPEFIEKEHLANQGRLYYSGMVSGENELYFEHLINSAGYLEGGDFYYVLRFTNTNSNSANLSFQRCGVSMKSNWLMALENYDKPASETCPQENGKPSFELSAKESVVFYDTGKSFAASPVPLAVKGTPVTGFDALVKFVANGSLRLDIFGFVSRSKEEARDFAQNTTATYTGNVRGIMPCTQYNWLCKDGPHSRGLVYTGDMNLLNVANNYMVFNVDDNTKPNTFLPVKVAHPANVKVSDESFNSWNSNIRNKNCEEYPECMQNALTDIIPLKVICEGESSTRTIVSMWVGYEEDKSLGNCDNTGGWNWANWGVHTVESIGIRNTSSSERTISLQASSTSAGYIKPYRIVNTLISDTGAVLTEGSSPKYIDVRTATAENPITVWTLKIPAGAQAMVKSDFLLGGNSGEQIRKQIKVEK